MLHQFALCPLRNLQGAGDKRAHTIVRRPEARMEVYLLGRDMLGSVGVAAIKYDFVETT